MIAYINVYGSVEKFTAEILDFWEANKSIPAEEIDKRLNQIGFIARDTNTDKIAGILTIFETFSQRLKHNFFAYRVFVAPAYQKQGIAHHILNLANAYLEQQFLQGKTRNIGALILSENRSFNAYRREAIWPATGFTFIGYGPKGGQIRIKYFREAKVSPQPQ